MSTFLRRTVNAVTLTSVYPQAGSGSRALTNVKSFRTVAAKAKDGLRTSGSLSCHSFVGGQGVAAPRFTLGDTAEPRFAATRPQFPAAEKTRCIAELCQREGIAPTRCYRWPKGFLEARNLRLAKRGLRTIYEPAIEALHHESKTMRSEFREASLDAHYRAALALMRGRWPAVFARDPYVNPHYARWGTPFAYLTAPPAPHRL